MTGLPEQVLDYAIRCSTKLPPAAALLVSAEGRVVSVHGALTRYHLEDVAVGTEITNVLAFRHGALPCTGDELFAHFLELLPELHVDVHPLGSGDGLSWILLFDVSGEAE